MHGRQMTRAFWSWECVLRDIELYSPGRTALEQLFVLTASAGHSPVGTVFIAGTNSRYHYTPL